MLAEEEGVEGGSVNGGGESSEEELAVLPRHTKVVVTGNNRTKSVLVGLQGVVKKAVGLGGWHWLVLTNGIEVKLQRNALSVIEAPTGNEEDDFEIENMQWNGSDLASDDTQKVQRSRHRSHKVVGSNHKSSSRSQSGDSHSKRSVSPARRCTRVDLSKLATTALWRYRQHFNLVTSSPNPSKEQLVDAVERHFVSQVDISSDVQLNLFNQLLDRLLKKQLDELQVIAGFVQAAKRLKAACN